jgi:glycine cleavage system H protein
LTQFAGIGVVESVKAVSDIFTPLGGEVLEINPAIESDASLVNREPFDGGWFYKLKLADDAEKNNLMSGDDYDKLIAEA